MMAYVQQILASAFLLMFGVLALLVWRRFGPVRRDRAALGWALTAANFLVVGAYSLLQAVLSAAFPEDSAAYATISSWSPGANLGRGAVSVVYGILLFALLVSRRRWASRVAGAAPTVLLTTALAGTLAGRLVPFSPHSFLTEMAVISTVTAIVVMAALFAAVRNDGLDQLLWLALASYGLKETISVSIMAVMAAWTMAYAGGYFAFLYWLSWALNGCMVAFAARRLQLATGGRRVPALFERVHALRRPAHG